MLKPKILLSSIFISFFKNTNYKKTVLISIYLLVLIAIFAFLYIIEKKGLKISMLNEKIQIITNLTILVSTLFAILYFDPLGLKSKVKFEQYIHVRDFLSFLKGLEFNILNTNNNGVLSFGLKGSIDVLNDSKLMLSNDLLTMKILVKYSEYHFVLDKTKEFKNNLLTPNELKNKINVSLWLGGINNETELESLEVRFNINPEGKDEFGKLFLTKWYNNSCSFVTLEEFIDEYGSLINICEKWLNSNKLS